MESKWCLVYSHDAVVAKLDELVGRGCQRITHCPDSYNTNGDATSWFITYIEPEPRAFCGSVIELRESLGRTSPHVSYN